MNFEFVPGAQVETPEIPYQDEVVLPAAETAVVVVDMQNDFVTEGGSLVVPAAAQTLPTIADLLDRARGAQARVVYTQDTHLEGDPEWQIWPEHCRKDTWGWQIVDALAPQNGEMVFEKSRYDGFYDTGMDHYLTRVWGVRHLVVVGTIASICVLHTAGSAGLRWFHVVAAADTMSALTTFDQALALRQISWLYAGHVTRTAQAIRFE